MNRYVDPVSVLGPEVAKRIEPLGDGRRYVRPGVWVLFLAWLVDFIVVVSAQVIGLLALLERDRQVGLSTGPAWLGLIGLVFGVPLVYGLIYGNGRALGGLLTGTRLVRLKNGRGPGFWAPWAMLVRTVLLPFLIFAFLWGSFDGGGPGGPPGSFRRASLDIDATQRLWAAEAAAAGNMIGPSW